MSIKQRAEQHNQQRGFGGHQLGGQQGTTSQDQQTQATGTNQIRLFSQPWFGIVDGQLVEVLGVTDIPNMSLAYLCRDVEEGWSAPVPYSQVQLFPTLNQNVIQQAMRQTAFGGSGSQSQQALR